MFDHLLPLIYRDYEFFDESNKENFGYIVRRRARMDLSVDTSVALYASSSLSARRRPLRSISPVGASKVASRTKKQTNQKRAPKSGKKQSKKSRDGDKKTTVVTKAIGKKRKPLEDITHLYVNERAQPPVTRASSRLSTSVAMRFF